jgi:hypothetical protein
VAVIYLFVFLRNENEAAVAKSEVSQRQATPSSALPPKMPNSAAPPKPPKASQADWTHKELVDFLKTKNGALRKEPATPRKGGVAVWISCDAIAMPGLPPFNTIQVAERGGGWDLLYREHSGVVHCEKYRTAEAARDEAGASNHAFAWGRFLFKGDPLFLEWLKIALR